MKTTVICKMQEWEEENRACLRTGLYSWDYNLWLTLARFFCASEEWGVRGLVDVRWRARKKKEKCGACEREKLRACDYLSCTRAWDGRKVGREEWDMTSSLQRDILLQAKQIRHIIRYRRPSNDSNKPNKDTMQLERERVCKPESLREREKRMKVGGGGLQTRNWEWGEFERLPLLHTHNLNCVALFRRLVSCLRSQHFKASLARFQRCSKSKQLNYAAN